MTYAEIQSARLRALVLPAAEREEIERRTGVRPALLSCLLGSLEIPLGIAVYALAHPGIPGIVGWLIWHANPLAWLGLVTLGTGLLRIVNYFVNHDSFGEPLVWLYVRARDLVRRRGEIRHTRERFGPAVGDRIVRDKAGKLVLLSSREKPWDEDNIVRVQDEFFRITGRERRAGRPHDAFAYILEVQPETEPLTGVVHTDATLPQTARSGGGERRE